MTPPTTNVLNRASDSAITDLIGNWFLYMGTTFVELTITLGCMFLMYNTIRSMLITRKFSRINDPINIYKGMKLSIVSTIFLRAVCDAVALLVWDEVTLKTLQNIIFADRILTILAMIPFSLYAYMLFRAGPSIEFQLLRKPIPTDMASTWRMMRKPILSLLTIAALCFVITIAKQ